jgi:hypothetical protein
MGVTIPGLAIKVDGDASGLTQTLGEVKQQLNGIGTNTAIAAAATGIGAAVVIAEKLKDSLMAAGQAAKAVFNEYMEGAGKLGDLKDLSTKLNIDPNQLISIKRMGRLSGANEEALTGAFDIIQNKLGEALSGGKNDPFAAIGLSMHRLASMDPVGQLGAIGDKLKAIADPAMREKLGEDLFGKSFRQISPAILEGTKGIEGAREAIEALGIAIDERIITGYDQVDDKVKDVYAQLEATKEKLLSGLSPAIMSIADSTSDWLAQFNTSGNLDTWLAKIEAASEIVAESVGTIQGGVNAALIGFDELIGRLKKIPGVGKMFEGVDQIGNIGGLKGTFGYNIMEDFDKKTAENLKEMAKFREEADAKRMEGARKRAMQGITSGAFQGIKNGVGVAEDFLAGLGKGMNIMGDTADNLKPKAISEPKFAGALEQGTAAAYAAAYQRDQKGDAEKRILKEMESANAIAKASLDALKAIKGGLPGVRAAGL